MKNNIVKLMMLLTTSVAIMTFSGCEEIDLFNQNLNEINEAINKAPETVEVDTSTDTMVVDEDTGIASLEQELAVKGEDFKLVCGYNIDTYDASNWRVTDSKDIGMTVKTKDLPEGYKVYIDHVHADVTLKSTSPQIDGIMQDSMDDTFHGQGQDGFYISNDEEYYNIFSIMGYTQDFYQLWGSAFGSYGSLNSSYQRLTEDNIRAVGTYAEKLVVVYDLSIQNPGADHVYTKSVISKVKIPLVDNTELSDSVSENG